MVLVAICVGAAIAIWQQAQANGSPNGLGRRELPEVSPEQVFSAHGNVQERDFERQNRLLSLGYRVMVVMWTAWKADRWRVMTMIDQALRAHPRRRVPIFIIE